MEKTQIKSIIEALLFVSPEPLSTSDLRKLLKTEPKETAKIEDSVEKASGEAIPEAEGIEQNAEEREEADPLAQLKEAQSQMEMEVSLGDIKDALSELSCEYQMSADRGFELVEVAGGFQFRTKAHVGSFLKNLQKIPKARLSNPSMETLAIVAYQQPATRQKIEEIRGVDSGGVIKTLLDRDLVRIVGRSEELGKPIMYGTTKTFLEIFSLKSLSDLPTLKDLETIEPQASSEEKSVPIEDDFTAESTAMEALDLESSALIDELESSIKSIRDLEKDIFVEDESDPST